MSDAKFVVPVISPFGLHECNSISSGADNGANNCDAVHFWNAARHGTTEEMVNNLLACGYSACNVGGHGNKGQFETGYGQGDYDKLKGINLYNAYYWRPHIERLAAKSSPVLSVYSCHTGEGEEGADLLYYMATILKWAVRARTGFTYCGSNGVTFEPGSVWQVASPDFRPPPIAAPSPHFLPAYKSIVTVGDPVATFHFLAVDEVVITKFEQADTGAATKTLTGPDALSFLEYVKASDLIQIDGSVMGLVTHSIELKHAGGRSSFTVYNGRMAVDDSDPKLGFYIRDLEILI